MPLARSLAIALLTLLPCAVSSARAADVDVEDLRPGLVATYRDGAQPPVEIVRLEPAVALNWKAGETAHPRLAGDGGSAEWTGYINILRAGNYRFSAAVRGKLQVSVAGKEVLSAEGKDDKAVPVSGAEVRLEAGPHPFVAKFTRPAGAACVELRWRSPQFPEEPLPHDVLFHLPAKAPAKLASDFQLERGRFLAEERSCVACHKPEASDKLGLTLATRQGPDLTQIGGRAQPGWLYAWLENPQAVRPGAAMPQLFTPDEAGRAEAYAVAKYLSALGGPFKETAKPPSPNDLKTYVKHGQVLFTSTGCIACHNDERAKDAKNAQISVYGLAGRQNFPLGALGSKTTFDKLALYLQNPHGIDPAGRMPNMILDGREAADLSLFLCQVTNKDIKSELPAAPAKGPLDVLRRLEVGYNDILKLRDMAADQQWVHAGKLLTVERGCVNCHTIAPDKKPLAAKPAKASFAAIKADNALTAGCLVDDPGKRGSAPSFAMSEADRKAVRQFLKEGSRGAGSQAPAYAARVTMQRLNCLACHSRDGEGGLSSEILEDLRKYEKAENAEAVSPPPLTGAGHKLRTPWLKQVLTQKARARPWMGLRMPQFGDATVGSLAEAFAALDGTEPDDAVHKVPLSAAKLEAGRKLVGKGGFGCISCHDIAGIPNTGTRGPDLAGMNQRVRFDWYGRWLSEAQRMQPGTRMPTVFPEGKSPLDSVLNGDAKAQADAVWAYLSLGPGLPLPDGLEPPKGLILSVKDRPYLLRTFMPDAGSRAIAIGYPGEISTSFDAATCRLAYAWSGNFLNASPVWDGRGGTPAKILGPKFWNAPAGCPWGVNDSSDPPDFAALAKNPAYGAGLPANKVFEGPKQLQFDGYTLDKDGLPTFRYRVEASDANPVTVKERPEPLRSTVAVGVGRHFALNVPANRTAWLLAGEGTAEPRLLDGKGNPIPVDLKAGKLELPTADRLIVLPQGGDKIIVLGTGSVPTEAKWLLQKQGTTWQAILHLPPPAKASDVNVVLNVWAPFRDEAELLKELILKK